VRQDHAAPLLLRLRPRRLARVSRHGELARAFGARLGRAPAAGTPAGAARNPVRPEGLKRLLLSLLLAPALAGGAACSERARGVERGYWSPPAEFTLAAPARDRGELCADLTELRVCWGADDASDGISTTPRPVPELQAPDGRGWRCSGRGALHACELRSARSGPFVCRGERCAERHVRLPDDGEWTCSDVSGAVVCVGGTAAAGVIAGPSDPGFLCGARARAGHAPGGPDVDSERVCVDLSPDFPDGRAHGWNCRFDYGDGVERICSRDRAAESFGDPAAPGACRNGRQAHGRCVPRRPQPGCWLDGDCASGACRVGSCVDRP
jgi:hypothetical protein